VKKVSVVLPALNEEETIGKVIDEVPVADIAAMGYSVEIVVVDNASTDGTADIAAAKGARVISEPKRGKGRAIRTAFAQVDADFVFMIDADYTYPSVHIPQMLKLLESGCDVVLGSRLKGHRDPGSIKRFNVIGNYLLSFMASVLYMKRVSDLCTGFWGFRREVIDNLIIDAAGFELEANMLSQVARRGYRIGEVPIGYRRRPTASKLGSVKAGFYIGRTLLRKRFG
jgi:dolichol-phosphate mannosyltransferase